MTMMMLAQAGGQLAGGLFGKNNTGEKQAAHYLDQIPGMYQPLQQQYGQLAQNPGQQLNQIGNSFQESPGLSFAIRQALRASRNSAAARGITGSPGAQQEAMQTAMNLGNQDYYNYLDRATPLYQTGLQGQNDVTGSIANAYMNRGNLAYQGAQQGNNALMGGLGGAAGTLGTLGMMKGFQGMPGGMNGTNQGGSPNGAGVFANAFQKSISSVPGYYPQELYGAH